MDEMNGQKIYKKIKNPKQNKCKNTCGLFADGKSLNILAAAYANVIADHFTTEELAVLAIFLTTIGDNLGTIVAANALICNGEEESFFIEQTLL